MTVQFNQTFCDTQRSLMVYCSAKILFFLFVYNDKWVRSYVLHVFGSEIPEVVNPLQTINFPFSFEFIQFRILSFSFLHV